MPPLLPKEIEALLRELESPQSKTQEQQTPNNNVYIVVGTSSDTKIFSKPMDSETIDSALKEHSGLENIDLVNILQLLSNLGYQDGNLMGVYYGKRPRVVEECCKLHTVPKDRLSQYLTQRLQ